MAFTDTDELQRSNARWEQFAHAVSHDLREPLRAIENLSGWIEEDLQASPKAEMAENVNLLRGRVARMGRLLDDLLEYSRVASRQYPLLEFDLKALMEEVIASLSIPQGIQVKIACRLAPLTASRVPLGRVLFHLLSNAVKHHGKPDGVVELRATDFGDHVEIVVADDGPGIHEKYHERIFQACQTLRPRDQVEGNGMGLALVIRILEHHGGGIALESAPGQGSRFFVTWPKGC